MCSWTVLAQSKGGGGGGGGVSASSPATTESSSGAVGAAMSAGPASSSATGASLLAASTVTVTAETTGSIIPVSSTSGQGALATSAAATSGQQPSTRSNNLAAVVAALKSIEKTKVGLGTWVSLKSYCAICDVWKWSGDPWFCPCLQRMAANGARHCWCYIEPSYNGAIITINFSPLCCGFCTRIVDLKKLNTLWALLLLLSRVYITLETTDRNSCC